MFLGAREGHHRSVAKAISWRVTGSIDTLLLSYLVTKNLLFASSIASAETITKIRREKPEDPRKYQLAVPQSFAGVVLQMLAKRPEDRYQTMAEVLRDLDRTLKYQGMTL